MYFHRVNGRAWDSFDAYLFDIDGTLLTCTDAVHYFAFCDALQALSGRALTLDGVTAHGNTDVGIIRDALMLAGLEETEWRSKLPQVREAMGSFVAERETEIRASLLPYVPEVLAHLQGRGATLGVATGNLESIGTLKLKTAGILDFFKVRAWSDEYERREDVFGNAVQLVREAAGPHASICFLGDTPADVLAAHAHSMPVIAVCTGVYSRQYLLETQPDLCLESFEELFR